MNHIERASVRDLDDFLDVLATASARLHARGLDQWPVRFADERVRPDIEAGDAYVVRDSDGQVIATVIFNAQGDPDFWTPDELAEPAFYLNKIATLGGHRGLGAALLDWCGREAALRGADLLRLDAWRTNHELHRYYLRQGFRHVRTVELPHRRSGALFERPARDLTTEAMIRHGLDIPSRERSAPVKNEKTLGSLAVRRVRSQLGESFTGEGVFPAYFTDAGAVIRASYPSASSPQVVPFVPGFEYRVAWDGECWKIAAVNGRIGEHWAILKTFNLQDGEDTFSPANPPMLRNPSGDQETWTLRRDREYVITTSVEDDPANAVRVGQTLQDPAR